MKNNRLYLGFVYLFIFVFFVVFAGSLYADVVDDYDCCHWDPPGCEHTWGCILDGYCACNSPICFDEAEDCTYLCGRCETQPG